MALEVHVWSDIACPWCYLGKHRLAKAIEQFGAPVSVTWHSFELDPRKAPRGPNAPSHAEYLAKKYGLPMARAQTMLDEMTARGEKESVPFDFSRALIANTFDAHRLLHLAHERGLQDAMKERLFRAYFAEGEDLESADALVRLGTEVGLESAEIAGVLASNSFEREVRADEEQARALGITGVPFLVIGRYGVSGAQSPETLLGILDRAHVESDSEAPGSEDASCSVDGC